MPLTRRRLLWLAAIGSAGIPAARAVAADPAPIPDPPLVDPVGLLGTTSDPETATLEAWADTLIPGEKRWDGDDAIAGVARGAGAVQAGALTLMRDPVVGVGPFMPAFAAAVNAEAVSFATARRRTLDPTRPPFVALTYADRSALVAQLVDDTSGTQQLLWFALAGLVFLAYHTAGWLPTAEAVRQGHPGLRAIGFPRPDADGLWRFPHFSYRRALARRHPATTRTGNPA